MGTRPSSKAIERHLDTRAKIGKYLEKKETETVILLADLADSTKYKAERSIVEGLAKIRDHNNTVSELIEKNKGTAVKWIGDAVMARFDIEKGGAQPDNAINSAIKIQEEFQKRNVKLSNDVEKFKTRIGISIGVVVDFRTSDPQGLPVDEAARIQALCKPGQILIHGKLRDKVDPTKVFSEFQRAKGSSPNTLFSRPIERRFKGIQQLVPVIEVIWGEYPLGIDREERILSRPEKDRLIQTLLENTRLFAPKGLNIRANIMAIDESKGRITICRGLHYNMDNFEDKNIELPLGDGCTGRAINRKEQVFADKKETIFKLVPAEMRKVPSKLKFILSTPIFDPDDKFKVIAVYNIDGFRLPKGNEIQELKAMAREYQKIFSLLL